MYKYIKSIFCHCCCRSGGLERGTHQSSDVFCSRCFPPEPGGIQGRVRCSVRGRKRVHEPRCRHVCGYSQCGTLYYPVFILLNSIINCSGIDAKYQNEATFTHTFNVTVFVSATSDLFNIVCKQRLRTVLNPFFKWLKKTDDIDNACKKGLNCSKL